MSNPMISQEDILMAHRYLYYVECQPAISDYIYDQMEKEARETLPASSPVQGVGSSLPSSYSSAQIAYAYSLIV